MAPIDTQDVLRPTPIRDQIAAILDQESRAISHLSRNLDDSYVLAIEAILSCRGKVVVTGVGKSGLVGRKISATFASTGTPSVFLHSGDAMHGDLGSVDSRDLIIAIGKSGESVELVALLPAFKKIGCLIIALTAQPHSTLARNSDIVLVTPITSEACPMDLAPTTSTTVAMAVGDALAMTVMKLKRFEPKDFALFHPGGKLGQRLTLKVRDVMVPKESCAVLSLEDSKIEDVLFSLSGAGLGIVLFTRRHQPNKLAGILTDGDIRRLLQRKGRSFFELDLMSVVNFNPILLDPELMAIDALSEMENRARALNVAPVVGRENEILGLVRLHDILKLA